MFLQINFLCVSKTRFDYFGFVEYGRRSRVHGKVRLFSIVYDDLYTCFIAYVTSNNI